jgi:Tfp pilus assembly protein PilO
MIRGGRKDQVWAAGGGLGALLLLAVGWLFLVHPQHEQAGKLREQQADAQVRLTALRHRLGELQRQNGDLAKYQAERDRDRRALPVTPALPDFLRELQAAGTAAGVAVNGFGASSPTKVATAATPTFSVQVTLTAVGTEPKLERFLDQLQRVQPRAVLISTANAVPDHASGSLAGTVTLTLSLQAFFTPTAVPTTAPH